MAEIIFFIIISSGSILGAVKFKRKYEEIFPVTCMGITILMFLFGLCGVLNIGEIFVIITAAVIWVYSLFLLIRNKDFQNLKDNILTPGAFFIAGLFFVLVFLNRGKLAAEYDEFTHWIDCVKEMIYLGDFVTNPASGSSFASYPPSMALFQFFYQKLYLMLAPGAVFSEWRCFQAFQIFSLSLFLPFFSHLSFKKPYTVCVYIFTVIVMPLFYYACYSNILIDPFLGMLTGAGLSRIFLEKKKDILYKLYMILLVSVLSLAKDAGQFFALFIGIFFAVDYLSESIKKGKITIKDVSWSVSIFLSLAVSRLLWKFELITSKVFVNFGGKVDLLKFGRLILTGGEGYEKITVSSFIDAFFEKRIGISALDIQVNYFVLLFIDAFLLYAAYKLLLLYEPERKKLRIFMIFGVLFQTIFYVYSLGATYVSNFSEAEAVALAGYNRYMNIGFLPVWIMVLMIFLYYISNYVQDNKLALSAIALILILVSPMESVTHFMMKKSVRYSMAFRQPYEEISEKIDKTCEDGAEIAFLYQPPADGESFWVVRFNMRPDKQVKYGYLLDKNEDGSLKNSPESMIEKLKENYDYAVTYMIDSDFVNDYGSLFEDINDIEDNSVYKIDKDTGLLKKCNS